MTSELKSDLRYFGYKDGHYISECKTCGCQFLGAKRSWACKPCAEKKVIEPKVTRAVPDVPELVTVGHLWEYAEYHSDDSGYYGYVKIITEENPSTHVSPASKIRHHRELVTRDQAAEIIAAKDKEIERLKLRHTDEMNDFILMGMARDEFKNRAEAAEAKLAQYEEQEIVGYVTDRVKTRDGSHCLMSLNKAYPYINAVYTSPAPAADMKAEASHD